MPLVWDHIMLLLATENISNIRADIGGRHKEALFSAQPSITQFCVRRLRQAPSCATPPPAWRRGFYYERRGGGRHVWDHKGNYSIIWSLVISWHPLLCVHGSAWARLQRHTAPSPQITNRRCFCFSTGGIWIENCLLQKYYELIPTLGKCTQSGTLCSALATSGSCCKEQNRNFRELEGTRPTSSLICAWFRTNVLEQLWTCINFLSCLIWF